MLVPPRFSAYAEASEQVFSIFERYTPLVEGLSIDEAFLGDRAHQPLVLGLHVDAFPEHREPVDGLSGRHENARRLHRKAVLPKAETQRVLRALGQ